MFSLRATLALLGRGGSDPSFRASAAFVNAELTRMRSNPLPLTRPVVIFSGYHTPAQVAWWMRAQLAQLTSGRSRDFLTVSYPTQTRIEQAAEQSLAMVRARWPDEPMALDAVGISMGGLVARFAALAPHDRTHPLRPTSPSPQRLPLARLFTFATPHQGSMRAELAAPDDAARDMKPGSPFLAALNRHPRDYELVCYTQRGDNLIAPQAAAPPGQAPFAADGSRLMSHFTGSHNPWFLVDLARRLRGEEPLLGEPRG
jgi:hypothetical protein